MNKKRIVLMCSGDFIEPFRKEGFEVLWTLGLVYSLFYGGKDTISLVLEEFKKRLNYYKSKVLEFNPTYFLADSGFFPGVLGRLETIREGEMSELWINFVKGLNKKGIMTIVSCVDDPWQFIRSRKYVRPIRNAFQIVKTHSMQLEAKHIKQGQRVIYFPNYINICFDKPVKGKEDPWLEDKIRASVFNFDLFFVGTMSRNRKIFFWRLSRKVQDLDYFFGNKDFFYTSRDKVDFDPLNKYHLQEIFKRTSINIVYGSIIDFLFSKTWGVPDRIFNIGYCHGFCLCDYRKHLIDLFDVDPQLYCFKTLDECHRKIRFYLKNKNLREELANEFHKQVMERHTVEKRVKQFIRDLEENK